MSEFNKLQIRAKALSVISELQYMQPAEKCLAKKLIDELKDISDKKSLADIMIAEMIKYEEPFSLILASIISEVVDNDTIIECVTSLISSNKYSDTEKYRAVQLLRGISSELSYENIIEYFDNPTEMLNTDTAKMLKKALNNPEAQIDFMDFLSAISNPDKEILLNTFLDDYEGDSVANILTPIIYSDFPKEVVEMAVGYLGDSKSSLALEPLQYVVDVYDDANIVQLAKKGLAKLKLAGASEEQVRKIIKMKLNKSIPDKCFATIPDGCGNQGILFTRLKHSGNFELATFIINSKRGIVESFGFFNVSENEIARIIQRFFRNDVQISVSPEYIRRVVNEAKEKTIKNKGTFPYEFIAWENIIKDIEPMKQSVKDFVRENITPSDLCIGDVYKVLSMNSIKTWFLTAADNSEFNKLCNICFKDEEITLEKIENEMNKAFNQIWNENEKALWIDKVIMSAYLLHVNGYKQEAQDILGLTEKEEVFDNIQHFILKRSIHNHIHNLIQVEKELSETTNIFRKQQKKESQYISSEKLSVLDYAIQQKWIGSNG